MNWHWLGNPWFIGIVGGIPSGLLVNWVTGLLLGKRENREYLQKINGANREIVYAIRPGISEGEIPTGDVLTSLINATARRYGVEPSDLLSATQIGEELVKEVMDSSFISSAQKAEYCGRLAALGQSAQSTDSSRAVQPKVAAEYRQRLISLMSTMLGFMAVVMTVSYSLLDTLRNRRPAVIPAGDHLRVFLPVLATLAGMAVSLVAATTYRDILRRKRRGESDRTPSVRADVEPGRARKNQPPTS